VNVVWLVACALSGSICLLPVVYRAVLSFRAAAASGAGSDAGDGVTPFISVIVAARNEEAVIGKKLRQLAESDYPAALREIIVVDDASDDGTAAAAAGAEATLLRLSRPSGKIGALNRGLERARGEVVVLTDADTDIGPGSLRGLAGRFRDPEIGAVSGRLRARPGGRSAGYERAYLAEENRLQAMESAFSSVPFMYGQLCGFRRALVERINPASAVDDIELALEIVGGGFRVVQEPSAEVEETAPPTVGELLRQKRRRGSCTLEVVVRHLRLLRPRYGFFALTFLVRRLLPFFFPLLLAVFLGSLALSAGPWAALVAAVAVWIAAFAAGGNFTVYMTLMQGVIVLIWYDYLFRRHPVGGNWKTSGGEP